MANYSFHTNKGVMITKYTQLQDKLIPQIIMWSVSSKMKTDSSGVKWVH